MAQQIIQAIVKGRLVNAVETRNMFYYGHDGDTPVQQDYDNIHDRIALAYNYLMPLTANTWQGYEMELKHWDGEQFVEHSTVAFNPQGTSLGDLSSFQSAMLFIARTTVRRAIGRKFFPGVDESHTNDGAFTNVAMGAMANVAAALLSPVPAVPNGSWYSGVHSKNALFAPFVSYSAQNIISSLRRRKPGYGI